jgi:hypothetical protein
MEVKSEYRMEVKGELPLKDGEELLSRLDKQGASGASVARILRGLDQIIRDNALGTTVVRLLVETSPEGKTTSLIQLRSQNSIDPKELLEKPVSILKLSRRVSDCMANANLATVGQVCIKTAKELDKYRNLGTRGINEIREKLSVLGLSLAGESDCL